MEFLRWWDSVKHCIKTLSPAASDPTFGGFVCAVTLDVFSNYLLPAHVHATTIQLLEQLCFVHAYPPFQTKTLFCSVITSINQTLPATISPLPTLP